MILSKPISSNICDLHFRHMVRRTCITPSVLSSHSPPFPLTIPPIPDAPATRSLLSSIRSAFVHATIIGTPAELWVKVPGPRGNKVLDRVEDGGVGSGDGSV
jgi:hypothetical protein